MLTTDTTFLTKEERLFHKAFVAAKDQNIISKDYQQIKKKLKGNKVIEIRKNKPYLMNMLQEEILSRYYYKEGVFQNKLKKDKVVLEAVNLLKDKQKYTGILSGN